MQTATSTPFESLRYCVRCCMPETQEGVKFDDQGICQACQSSEQKIHINWVEREKRLRNLLENAKAKAGNNYDCIVPISGGKDSVFQLHVLVKVYGMKPLTVTFSHNWYSETGWYNLQNALQQFDVDHVMFTPNRSLVNRLARRSLGMIGDACWHCHAGVGAFPLQAAVRFNIPLLIWGESVAESSGRASYEDPVHKFDREYFTKVSAKRSPKEMTCGALSERDLYPFNVPSLDDVERVGVHGIHLGDYIFWDEERQTEFICQEYGWKETEMEGAYKGYKSAECIMAGVHDFTCYLKRGYGRATFQACVDVRNGLMTREEGFKIAQAIDSERPGALDYYLKITDLSESEFYETMRQLKHLKLIDINPPVHPKQRQNREVTVPFFEQLIAKHRYRQDPREEA
ncbi:N-acetyl sugar amidotransferase [Methylosinus sporium]|uniref:N-acetyl sugar amidotransferase n=1 Tax=Methylosinus sporium TaxID=428 RepID=UPI00383BDB6D